MLVYSSYERRLIFLRFVEKIGTQLAHELSPFLDLMHNVGKVKLIARPLSSYGSLKVNSNNQGLFVPNSKQSKLYASLTIRRWYAAVRAVKFSKMTGSNNNCHHLPGNDDTLSFN